VGVTEGGVSAQAVRLAANRLFPERHLMAEVEEYASAALRREDAGDGEAAAAEARCELYMALCTKKHTLLRGLLEGFGRGSALLRQAIQKQVRNPSHLPQCTESAESCMVCVAFRTFVQIALQCDIPLSFEELCAFTLFIYF
jgi:hypothetical protein